MQSSTQLGQIEVCFDGPKHWAKKAEASFLLQIEWLNKEKAFCYFPTPHRYIFSPSAQNKDVELGDCTATTSRIHIDKWYKANASLIFQIEAIRQGALLFHGNGFEHKGGAHVFAADGGVGKTSMLLAMQKFKQGEVSFVGDDLIWLTPDGHVLPYIRPMCVYSYHYRTNKEAFRPHPILFMSPSLLGRAVRLVARNILTFLNLKTDFLYKSFAPANGYAVVPVNAVFHKICPASPLSLRSFNYLCKGAAFSLSSSSGETITQLTCQSLLQEFREYRSVLDQLCIRFYGEDFEKYAAGVFQRIVPQTQNFLVTTTGRWDKPEIEQLLKNLSPS